MRAYIVSMLRTPLEIMFHNKLFHRLVGVNTLSFGKQYNKFIINYSLQNFSAV